MIAHDWPVSARVASWKRLALFVPLPRRPIFAPEPCNALVGALARRCGLPTALRRPRARLRPSTTTDAHGLS